MHLYNTLTKKVEEFKPINPPEVKVYTCGPTVYDYPHIGNWFTFIRYDLLIRTLVSSGYKPKWVMNITDVGHLTSDADEGEDKLAKEAAKEGKTAWDIASFYSDYFITSLNKLNFIIPSQLTRATNHIAEQINLIQKLEAKGFTYRIDDGIYYDTSKFSKYGDFANLDLDEQQAGARIELNPQKKNPNDFALWKFSPREAKRDMEWDSPWGIGFPGWHIECSAMCMKYLGETVDIHCGGIDHIPIHHTNEIAQSEAVTGKPLANYWMHSNHILLEDQKISKSLGNTITIEDIETKGYSTETLRLLVAESHYRSQSKFRWDTIASANQRLVRYRNFAVRRFQQDGKTNLDAPDLISPMQDDLNTPQALANFEEFLSKAEDTNISKNSIETAIKLIDDLLGLQLSKTKNISQQQKALINDREKARNEKDWQRSDDLRHQLEKMNISLLDTPHGTIWQHIA